MSEAETQVATAKAKKAPPEQKTVKMTDGRDVIFVGKRRMLKEYSIDADTQSVSTRFDFVNGETREHTVKLDDPLLLQYVGHAVAQKVGDETAGDESVDDMVIHVDNMLGRLAKGEWGAERGASDGFSGAATVVKALVEVMGKDVAWVKEFLERKLEQGKTATPPLTRQKLYQAFRANQKILPVIQRIEQEKAAKAGKDSGIDVDAELDAAANS